MWSLPLRLLLVNSNKRAPWVVDSRRYAFFLGHRSIRSVTLWFFVTTSWAVLVNDLDAAPAPQDGQMCRWTANLLSKA